MTSFAFFQPVAVHVNASCYLVVRDTEDKWFLWTGDDDEGLVEIPEACATWMRSRPEIEDIPEPQFWFQASSLPVVEHSTQWQRH